MREGISRTFTGAFTPAGVVATALAALFLLASTAVSADGGYNRKYEVTITNLTPGQSFTPQLVATHSRKVSLFELGQPAGEALEPAIAPP